MKTINLIVVVGFFLSSLLLSSNDNGILASPPVHSSFNAYEHYHDQGVVPIVKLPVVQQRYIEVILGNPGRPFLLRLDFGLNTSIVLFSSVEDTFKDYSSYPSTLLAYFGPALVRLSFRVSGILRDSLLPLTYDGVLGLGHRSDVWKYWSRLTVSPHRLVLGDYDRSLARVTYNPFRLEFSRDSPSLWIQVQGTNYTLTYDPALQYSFFPHSLYKNTTNFDVQINHLHLEIDANDIKVKLLSGFDRTLVKKNLDVDDLLIVLGEQFSHNFVLFYDAVNRTKVLMPSYDLFADRRAEPVYSFIGLFLFTFLAICWLGVIFTEEKYEVNRNGSHDYSLRRHVSSALFSGLEVYTYFSAMIFLIVGTVGFAQYRTMSFFMQSTTSVHYIIFTVFIASMCVVGSVLAMIYYNSYHALNIRRMSVECVAFSMLWLFIMHWRNSKAIYVMVLAVSLLSILRAFQFLMVLAWKNTLVAVVASVYTALTLLFLVFYNIVPIMNYYFFGASDSLVGGLVILLLIYLLPLQGIYSSVPLTLLRNTVIDLYKHRRDFIHDDGDVDYQLSSPSSKMTEKTTKEDQDPRRVQDQIQVHPLRSGRPTHRAYISSEKKFQRV